MKAAYKGTRGFETSNGTLYVSKPYRSTTSKKLRALVTFVPRVSVFETSFKNEFRGFFSLFWISIFIFTVQTYVRAIETHGAPLNLRFATMFSQDAITLALSDAALVLATGICVPFAKAMQRGWISYYWTGIVIQHIIQTIILFGAISWTFNRSWPWVQSGFLTLHSLVLVMKMHSYITVNGQLQYVDRRAKKLYKELQAAVQDDAIGGWDRALYDARSAAPKPTASGSGSPIHTDDGTDRIPIGTPPIPEGISSSYVDVNTANALRKRLAALSVARSESVASSILSADGPSTMARNGSTEAMLDVVGGPKTIHKLMTKDLGESQASAPDNDDARSTSSDESIPEALRPHPLTFHPERHISDMAKDYSELRSELVSSGPLYAEWPNTIGWKNFAVYQLIPTLVYQLEYPRTDRIRPFYLFEKTVATFGTFALLYTVTESFILPYTPTKDQSFLRSLLDLALPFMIAYILLFYIIFECICNGFAELSYFADRQFYEDWWNSTSWDEFARKWNKPVHTFLLNHVYAATMVGYRTSKTFAMFITFFVSALAHELVMAVVTQKFRGYLFTLQIIQIPLIMLGRVPAIKRNKTLGNIVFWLGLYAGFPLLCVAYVAY